MPFYSLVCPVKHRPGFQKAFKGPEGMFYLVKMFVMIEDDRCVHILHISCNSKKSIILFVLFNFLLIDLVIFLFIIFEEVMRCFLFKQRRVVWHECCFVYPLLAVIAVFFCPACRPSADDPAAFVLHN